MRLARADGRSAGMLPLETQSGVGSVEHSFRRSFQACSLLGPMGAVGGIFARHFSSSSSCRATDRAAPVQRETGHERIEPNE